MEEIKKLLFDLCEKDCIGNISDAKDYIKAELSKYAEVSAQNGNVFGLINGKSDYTIMLEAHLDQVGFVVTDVDSKGFLTLSAVGGTDIRTLPAKRVNIYGKEKITGTFCSTPPHLKSKDEVFDDIKNFKVDSLLGSQAKNVISAGDYVTFAAKPQELCANRVTAKSLDNRACVSVLLALAKELSKMPLEISVLFCFSKEEELGTRGARTAAFAKTPDEAVVTDVSFGDAPDVGKTDCGVLGGGVMIGVSPILDRKSTEKFFALAKHNNISYQTEVMSGKTGTDSDVITVTKSGIKTSLLSVPLRNMHTDTEIIDLLDLESLKNLLKEYVLDGGLKNA